MLADILREEKIEYFSALPVGILHLGNKRLFEAVPPEASAVFFLMPYFAGGSLSRAALARFAAVPDYHGFADKVFLRLCSYGEMKYPGRYFHGFTDHSPFAEIDAAARAGLGIIGDNGLLINEKYSSFVCIGELVTTLTPGELLGEGIEYGDGKVRHCGHCGACAAACPSHCAGRSERDRCVSAVNQKKGELSPQEISAIAESGYIWGCDECQRVCPHTKKAFAENTLQTPIDYFKNAYLGNNPTEKILEMDDEAFAMYPFSWRRREIIGRNIKIVTGRDI